MMQGTDRPTELVLYPGAGHHFIEQGKPSHRVDVVHRVVDWPERWVNVPVEPNPGH